MAQFNALQVTSPALVSLTGVSFSLISVEGSGVHNGLMALTGNNVSQAIRALHTSRRSGGYARLDDSLKALDRVVSLAIQQRPLSKVHTSTEPGWCTAVLNRLIVRAKCVGFGQNTGPLRAISYSAPEGLCTVTRRVLAVGALWVEIMGSSDVGQFIVDCLKQEVAVPDELRQELSRMCLHLGIDLYKAGLGIVHEGEELMMMIGDHLKSQMDGSSSQNQLSGCELVDMLWTLHIKGEAGGKYWTNDSLVFYIYTGLKRLSPDIPVQLDFDGRRPRHELSQTLPRYRKRTYVPGSNDPWLVRCSNEDFWDLMWLHNRPGQAISEYQYLEKVKRMQEMLMEHIKLSPTETEDKGLCSLVSFDPTRVPIRDTTMHRAVERACIRILHTDFGHFARVATSVEFFSSEELKASEALETAGFTVEEFEGGEEHVVRALDLKLRTMALLVLQTIVMKSLAEDQKGLILYTPAMHTSATKLKGVLRVLAASGFSIQLWRIILVSGWFCGGTGIDYNVRDMRSDIKQCVGVMGPRSTMVLAGVMNGSDDPVANNKLWVCNGPVPDLPTTSCGLILVDSAFTTMSQWLVDDTCDQSVTPTQADADVVIDVGPSYGNDEDKVRSWIRSGGLGVGFFNPILAMSRVLTSLATCRCMEKGRIPTSGAYRGWPVKMSELIQKPDQFQFHVSGSTPGTNASKLIFLVHEHKAWRYCLAGSLSMNAFVSVIVGDCKCVRCVEEKLSSTKSKLSHSRYEVLIL